MAEKTLHQKLAELQAKAPEAVKAIEAALAKADKQFGTTTEAALRLASALVKGADAQKALNTSLEKTYQGYLQVVTQSEKTKLAEDARVEAYKRLNTLIETNQKLGDEEKETFKTILKNQEQQLKNAEKQEKLLVKSNKHIKEHTKEAEKAKGTWDHALDILKGVALTAGGIAAIRFGGKWVKGARAAKPALEGTAKAAAGAKVGLEGAAHGAEKLGAKAAVAEGATKGLVKKGLLGAGLIWGFTKVTATLDGAGKKLEEWVKKAEKTYLGVSDLTTGFAQLTGQVLNSDSAVRRSGKGMATFASRVIQLQRRNQQLGATVKDITTAYQKMITTSRTFGKAMTSTRAGSRMTADSLAEMAFRFTKVGLNTDTFAAAVDVLGKTYRTSKIIKESRSLGTELVNIARVTGQLPDQVGKDFAGALNVLAAYSLPKARDIFKKLSVAAAEAGVNTQDFLTVAGGFDDIEAAAGKVGELNAMLGGPYLNTLDMVNATEEERIAMLKGAMDQTGKNFNQMDRFMQKAIAQQLGVDVQKASRIFGADQGAIDATTKAVDAQGASFQKLVGGLKDGAARNATSITQQQAAIEESTVLMEGAFAAVDKMSRRAMATFRTVGHRFRQDIGSAVVGTLQTAGAFVDKLAQNVERGGSVIGALGSAAAFGLMASNKTLSMAIIAGGQQMGLIDKPELGGAPGVTSQAEQATGGFTASPITMSPTGGFSDAEQMQRVQSSEQGGMNREELLGLYEKIRSGDIVINIDGQAVARAVAPYQATSTGNPGGYS